jgi:hypothetical protein
MVHGARHAPHPFEADQELDDSDLGDSGNRKLDKCLRRP